MTSRSSSVLYVSPTRIPISGVSVFCQTPSPLQPLLTLSRTITETEPYPSETVPWRFCYLCQGCYHFFCKSPAHMQPAILQAVLEDTYIDYGGVRASSTSELSALQVEIGKILRKGGFFVKSWECSGESGVNKYLFKSLRKILQHSIRCLPRH